MDTDIVLRIPKVDHSFAELLESDASLGAIPIPGAGIDGGSEYLVLLIPVAHFTAKALIDLVKAHWEKAKNVQFEIDGMKVSGASLEEISTFLEKHSQKRKPSQKRHGHQ